MGRADQFHHWVPQHYLRRFATPRGPRKRPRFYANTLIKQRSLIVSQNVNSICGNTNWNRIAAPSVHPNAFEEETSKFDTSCADAIQSIVSNLALPTRGSLYGIRMIEFVASLMVRNDHNRVHQEAMQRQFLRANTKLDEVLQTSAHWQKYRQLLHIAQTGLKPVCLDYAQALALHQRGELQFEFDQTPIIRREIVAMRNLCEAISRRRWFLRPVEPEAPDLVTSDCPVQMWRGPQAIIPFDFHDTAILLPLSPRLLLAAPGGPFLREAIAVPADEVSEINSRTFSSARVHLVSQAELSLIDTSGNTVNWGPDIHVGARRSGAYEATEYQGMTMYLRSHPEQALFT